MRNYTIPQAISVEVQIDTANQGRFYLPDSETLRKANIIGLSIRPQDDAGNAQKSISNRNLVGPTLLKSGFLTLRRGNTEFLQNVPLGNFTPEVQGRQYAQISVEGGYDPTQSFIQFADPTLLVSGTSVELVFYYIDHRNTNVAV